VTAESFYKGAGATEFQALTVRFDAGVKAINQALGVVGNKLRLVRHRPDQVEQRGRGPVHGNAGSPGVMPSIAHVLDVNYQNYVEGEHPGQRQLADERLSQV
jgi:hypothetical protein